MTSIKFSLDYHWLLVSHRTWTPVSWVKDLGLFDPSNFPFYTCHFTFNNRLANYVTSSTLHSLYSIICSIKYGLWHHLSKSQEDDLWRFQRPPHPLFFAQKLDTDPSINSSVFDEHSFPFRATVWPTFWHEHIRVGFWFHAVLTLWGQNLGSVCWGQTIHHFESLV